MGSFEQRRSSHINSIATNPYVRKVWQPDELVAKIQGVPSDVIQPWVNAIKHLQSIAWRGHSKDCTVAGCIGCGEDVIRSYFHTKQCEYLIHDGREAWLITSRRWGKTEVAVFRVMCKLLGYNPLTNDFTPTPQHWWIAGLDFPMVRDALLDTFQRLMPPETTKWGNDMEAWGLAKTDMIAHIFNGSKLGFKSCDSGPSKFQSVGLDGVHFDEEPPESVYREAKLRIKGGKKLQIRGSMTPDPEKGLTWTYKKILKNDTRQQDSTNLRVWTGSIGENPGILKEEVDNLVADLEPWEQAVCLEGHYDIGRGRCAFSREKLIAMETKNPIRIEELIGGTLRVWEDPVENVGYIISGDPAEGLQAGDNSSSHILRRDTYTIVATLTGKIDPDIFGRQLITLAKWYNFAWIIVEANNHGFTTLTTIRNSGYTNVYSEKSQEDLGLVETRKMGWYTSSITRPILVDALAKAIREGLLKVPDQDTIDECMSFIIYPDGKAKAQSGCLDDRVMSLGLTLQGHARCPAFDVKQIPQVNAAAKLGWRKWLQIFGPEPTKQSSLDWMIQ